ncbi:OmpA family protein [Aureispira anguillae]|uniref:OmpA family protein n=1 Tax=Aureispira anguillae TaxID=2864201 RepID=A0A915YK09_9BACT|nr:OmpA family protein [Aureispira anguillae]BDS14341.1 OmpA family protein [Aureispira anguillae]
MQNKNDKLPPKDLKVLEKIEQELNKYTQLYAEDGTISEEEQEQLNRLQQKVKKIKQQLLDDPIKKGVDFWVDFSLETFVNIQGWGMQDGQEIINTKIELDQEGQKNIALSANANYHISIWTKANIDYWHGIGGLHHKAEYIIKDHYCEVAIQPNGKLSFSRIADKIIEASKPDLIQEYSVELSAQYNERNHSISIKGAATTPAKDEEGVKYEKQVLSNTLVGIQIQVTDIVPFQTIEKELVFERENQAILSSDQASVCRKWWQELDPRLKELVRNRKAKVVIQGFTSPTGTERYNEILGTKRAQHIARLLKPKIGVDDNGNAVCIFECIGEGEETGDPKRYVKIKIVEL